VQERENVVKDMVLGEKNNSTIIEGKAVPRERTADTANTPKAAGNCT
jgi:hypothetical protein